METEEILMFYLFSSSINRETEDENLSNYVSTNIILLNHVISHGILESAKHGDRELKLWKKSIIS